MYIILPRTKKIASDMNLSIHPSKNPKKKIDVFDNKTGKFLGAVGASEYMDYPHYIRENGLAYAMKRKKAYEIRHNKDLGSGLGRLAYKLLWS